MSFSRATQPPLPPLIFSHIWRGNDPTPSLYHFSPNCADFWTPCSGETRQLFSGLHFTYPVVTWSPDGTFIALRDQVARWLFFRAECLLDTSGNESNCPHSIIDGDWSDLRFAWGSDGSVIALTSRGGHELHIFTRGCWDGSLPEACATFTTALTEPDGSGFPLNLPDWSADGRWLTFTEGISGSLVRMSAACLDTPDTCYEAVDERVNVGVSVFWSTLSADGETALYFAAENARISRSQIYQYYWRTGEKRLISAYGEEASVFDWTNDERFLAYSEGDGDQIDLVLLDLERGVRVHAVRNVGWNVYPSWGVPPA